jgi:hypothetical protein
MQSSNGIYTQLLTLPLKMPVIIDVLQYCHAHLDFTEKISIIIKKSENIACQGGSGE